MLLLWVGFLTLIILLLSLDLGVFHRKDHVIKAKEAILWTLFWVFLSLLFNVFIYFAYKHHLLGLGLSQLHVPTGEDAAIKYFTGYIIEKSLSLDNIFVIAILFSFFKVPAMYQHRVLFWGILGALVMRGLMIFAGAILIQKFSWMIYVFGVLLVITAIKMLISRHDNLEPDKNIVVKFAKKMYPISDSYEGDIIFSQE